MGSNRQRALALFVVAIVVAASVAGCTRPPWSRPTTTTAAPPTTSTNPPAQTRTATERYGPYLVPAARSASAMGMIHNAFAQNLTRPCTNCYITRMRANLITADGTTVNVDDGLWLHHMVMWDSAKRDMTCPNGLFNAVNMGQRFFSSGNERHEVRFDAPYGYRLGANDRWTMIYELMNMTAQARDVYVTVTFDYVPATTPGYRDVTPIWLDVNQCGTSEKPARTGQYSYDSTFTMPGNGNLLRLWGHVHDGGTHLTVTQNGQLVCDSVATYGGSPEFVEGPASVDMPGMPHISYMTECDGTPARPVAALRAGDVLKLTAYYDSDAHMQMGTEPVMGIALGYLDAG